jgi:hypothetical protein
MNNPAANRGPAYGIHAKIMLPRPAKSIIHQNSERRERLFMSIILLVKAWKACPMFSVGIIVKMFL